MDKEIMESRRTMDNNSAVYQNGASFYRDRISEAEMVLVGLGEEFDDSALRKEPRYADGAEKLKAMGLDSFLPAWGGFCAGIGEIKGINRTDAEIEKQACSPVYMALERLRTLLEPKNYFVVSISTDIWISRTAWKAGRLVMPCGAAEKKQCAKGCEGVLEEITEEDRRRLQTEFEKLYAGEQTKKSACLLGKCPVCGSDMAFNNIYAENYNESGYLEQWQLYMKWLQGTVNKKLLILELGVGMRFPTVIRWPFEKAAYFNNKAFFCRVNKNLYQLAEELSGKGAGISQNAIDWLCGL